MILLRRAGLFDRNVPRYTSYPPATQFHDRVGTEMFGDWLGALKGDATISLYVHIPFCTRLCWFCACRTQGINSDAPVEAYLTRLRAEAAMVARQLPEGVTITQMHWGGGSPTVLRPDMITALAADLKATLPFAQQVDFSVEIDPTSVDTAKIAAFAAAGMTRASIGVQDFEPRVQAAIGRQQSAAETQACVADLRAHGVTSINLDLVYGLPHQDAVSLSRTLDQVLDLTPDRVALFGYAHVPWMAKRQQMIPEAALPGTEARYALFNQAAARFQAAGLGAIGIDHFAKPTDSLARAAQTGQLRRNFQGYTEDGATALIGLGASSISRLPQGYAQNAATTANYSALIDAESLATKRGYHLSVRDRIMARAIEMLMCDFAIDPGQLAAEFGTLAEVIDPALASIRAEFAPMLNIAGSRIEIAPEYRALTRIIASGLDEYHQRAGQHSHAI